MSNKQIAVITGASQGIGRAISIKLASEGYFTVQAVYQIAKEKKIDMPIVNSVYKILYKNISIKNEISNLLNRPFTKDFNSL